MSADQNNFAVFKQQDEELEKIDFVTSQEAEKLTSITPQEAEKLGKELLEHDADALQPIMQRFAQSYDSKPVDMSDKDWLQNEFQKELPEKSADECRAYAEEIVKTIEENTYALATINKYCDEGGKKERWLADELAKACTGMSVVQYGEYLSEIDRVLDENNKNMLLTVLTKDGNFNQNPNLHGFIAEQALANSFNRNAALRGSALRAEVLKPVDGYARNSVDIEIFDGKRVIERDQVKFCKDANETVKAFKHGNYVGQGKVVPNEQAEAVAAKFPRSKVKGYIGGSNTDDITSDKISRESTIKEREKLLKNKNYKGDSWNTYNTKDLAYNLGRQAVYAGAGAAVFTAGLDIAIRKINGDELSASETMALALKTGADAGAKTATAGALKVAAEKGMLRMIPKGIPGFQVATIACLAVENAKIAYKYITGEISGLKAVDMVGRVSCATIGGSLGALNGSLIAAAMIANPVGAVVAGTLGLIVGSLAGSKIGECVYEGAKAIGKAAVSTVKSVGRAVYSGVKSACSTISSGVKAVASFLGF